MSDNDKFCHSCGFAVNSLIAAVDVMPKPVHSYPMPTPYAKKWNWGGFLFPQLWTLGNMGWRGFLIVAFMFFLSVFDSAFMYANTGYSFFISAIILTWSILCGIFGNRWAWRFGSQRDDIKNFERKQRIWWIVGLVFLLLTILIVILLSVFYAVIIMNYFPIFNSW